MEDRDFYEYKILGGNSYKMIEEKVIFTNDHLVGIFCSKCGAKLLKFNREKSDPSSLLYNPTCIKCDHNTFYFIMEARE